MKVFYSLPIQFFPCGTANARIHFVVKKIILCSSNPILVKSLYGMLRDEGHTVETIEHPAFAVQMIMHKAWDVVIIDSEPFGLSGEDAAEIIRSFAPATGVVFIGKAGRRSSGVTETPPLDLEEFKKTIHRLAV